MGELRIFRISVPSACSVHIIDIRPNRDPPDTALVGVEASRVSLRKIGTALKRIFLALDGQRAMQPAAAQLKPIEPPRVRVAAHANAVRVDDIVAVYGNVDKSSNYTEIDVSSVVK